MDIRVSIRRCTNSAMTNRTRIMSCNIVPPLRTGVRPGAATKRAATGALLALLLSATAFGTAAYPTAGPQFGVDDFNTSTVYQLSDVNTATSGFYSWVASSLSQLQTSSAGAFSFQWSLMDAVSAAIQDPVYEAWVVTRPAVTGGGKTFHGGADDKVEDRGGAAIVLTYTGVPGVTINNPCWIQVYRGSRHGVLENPTIDNPTPTTAVCYPSNASGTLAGGGVWLEDRPFTRELEYELNPVANEEFVSLLVGQNIVNGIDDVTIYGGVDWGYTYTAYDTPEPASIGLLAAGIGAIAMLAFLRRRKSA